MNIEDLRTYCMQKPGVLEEMPFGNDTLVFKVYGKIFLLTSLVRDISFNVKCDPEIAIGLRERYHAVTPGYHMNKKHWNTVKPDGIIPLNELYHFIDHSYELVLRSIPRKLLPV